MKLSFLSGKKSILLAVAVILGAFIEALTDDGTVDIQSFFASLWEAKEAILGGLALIFVRLGIGKTDKKIEEVKKVVDPNA